MSRSVTFTVLAIPRPQGSMRAWVPKGSTRAVLTSDNAGLKGWRNAVAVQAMTVAAAGQFVGPVAMVVHFTLPRPDSLPRRIVAHVRKPDLDKLLRSVGDALTGVLYRDDSQVVELHARKLYAPAGEAPKAEITVRDAAGLGPMPGWLFEEDRCSS